MSYANSNLFYPYVTFPTGSWPEAVAIGDVNGDGRNDVVMITYYYSDPENDYNIFVFLQDSSGQLQPPIKYKTSSPNPTSIAIGDVNHDGRADVVVGGSNIEVFMQNASGGLNPGISYPTVNSSSIRIADLNNDGLLDVVGIGGGTSTVDVLLQNSGGTLDPPATYSVTHEGYDEIDIGDVNNDGITDIIVMSGQGYSSPNFGVLLQQLIGSFSPPVYYDLGGNELTHGVAVGDVNGDNLQDIVVTYGLNRPNSRIGVFLQNIAGTLEPAISYDSYDIPEPVVIADVNNDGKKDIIVVHGGWMALGVYLQGTNRSLLPEELYPLPYASHYNPQGLAVGDINGDGFNDIVIADYNNGLVVLYNIGTSCTELSITSHPRSQTIQSGQTASMSVSASGTAPFSYQWYQGPSGNTSNPISGAIVDSYTTPPLTQTMDYWVRVTNFCGSADSNTAIITVTTPCTVPSITTQPQSQTIQSGQTASMSVGASGTTPFSYQWYQGSSGDTSNPMSGATSSSYTTPALTQTTNYWVRVYNNCGSANSSTATITVTAPCTSPSITTQPQSQTIQSGQTASMSVSASGTAPLSYHWYQGSSGDTSNPISGANSSSHATPALTQTTSYWVRVTNSCGSADSNTATVTVAIAGISVVSPNGAETWLAGTTQTIRWSYTGNPGPYVKIELLKGGVVNRTIKSLIWKGTGGTGSCNWTIPANQAHGTDHRIRVSSTTNGAYTHTSDSDFTIAAPTITVVSPNGGGTLTAGTTQIIRWTYTGNPGSYVKIELLKGGVVNRTIKSFVWRGTGGSGSFNWRIPANQTPGEDYRIRVTSATGASIGTSDSDFTIAAPTITVVSPNSGETWTAGSVQTIRWTYTGNPGLYVKIELLKGGVVDRIIKSFALKGSRGNGFYNWRIPSTQAPGSDYQIKVTSTNNSAYTDTSDSDFSIQ